MKSQIDRIIFAIVFLISFLTLIAAGVASGFRERHGEAFGNSQEDAGLTVIAMCHKQDGLTARSVLEKNAPGEDMAGELVFREIMPEGYSQICQTDYTCFV